MKHFTDYPMDYVVSLDSKETGRKEGRILARYTDSGTCHTMVELYTGNSFNQTYTCGYGQAGGYGYDKLSTAIVDACHKAKSSVYDEKSKEYMDVKNPILTGSYDEISGFVFSGDAEKRAESLVTILQKSIIPVYSGAGNQCEAFSLFFRYNQVF